MDEATAPGGMTPGATLDGAPPQRDGVGASRVGVGPGAPATVLEFLAARFPAAPEWSARLARGDVLDARHRAVAADTPCVAGMTLWYWRAPPAEPRVPFEIELLHQDELLVVIDKPHFLATTPGGRHLVETALVRLRQRLGIADLAPMHRLDRDTAGVVAFTVQPATRYAYHALLRNRQAHKVYEAVAAWRADLVLPHIARSRLHVPAGADFMQVRVVDGEPNAQTRIELLQWLAAPPPPAFASWAGTPLAHYRLMPLTGRKHQLRAQMSALGVPIVGDRIYPQMWPDPGPGAAPDYTQPLQLLARQLAFTDPVSGEARCFTSRRRLLCA